jgi:hypothetical protein
MDSNSNDSLSDENESIISFYELNNSTSEDSDSFIEELDQNSINEWQWEVDNLHSQKCFSNYNSNFFIKMQL